jgi:hypothetical protein
MPQHRTPQEKHFHFSGDEQPDLSEDDIAIASANLIELGKQWYAEDIASGRIKPPARKPRVAKVAKVAKPAPPPENWLYEQWHREDEMRAHYRDLPADYVDETWAPPPYEPVKPKKARKPRKARTSGNREITDTHNHKE